MRLLLAAAAALAWASAARAHDIWIQPSSFHPKPGESVGIAIRVGEGGAGDPVKRSASRILRFAASGPGGVAPIDGKDGDDPAGQLKIAGPGAHLIEYRSRRSFIEMKPAEFAAYLKEEGLDARPQPGRNQREVYSRCLKSIVVAGDGAASGFERPLGCRIELVPIGDPRGGKGVGLRLLLEGKPLAGALVRARRLSAKAMELSARTGADGRVRLAIDKPGAWLVTAVRIGPAPKGVDAVLKAGEAPKPVEADWESHWASLTFERR